MDHDPESDGSEMKECRYCGEEIRKAAVKCRHCGEHLKRRPGGGRGNVVVRKQIDDAATLALIMAIIGIVACPITLPIGIIKGNEAKRRRRVRIGAESVDDRPLQACAAGTIKRLNLDKVTQGSVDVRVSYSWREQHLAQASEPSQLR